MLDDTIELLTKQMIEDLFENKDNEKEVVLRMTKTQLYKFSIELIKVIKRVDEVK